MWSSAAEATAFKTNLLKYVEPTKVYKSFFRNRCPGNAPSNTAHRELDVGTCDAGMQCTHGEDHAAASIAKFHATPGQQHRIPSDFIRFVHIAQQRGNM